MAVRPQPRPTASRSQIGLLITVAVVVTLGLAVLTSVQAQGPSPEPTPAVMVSASVSGPEPATPLPPESTSTPEATPLPTDTPLPRVGIVAGHWGNDSGAECPDGVTEQQTNLKIATLVMQKLRAKGIWTDLLQEFDSRLTGYHADVLISIHADSCDPIDADPPASGFKVARSVASAIPTTEDRLVTCLKTEYAQATKMYFHENSITPDMGSYHSFAEVNADTPAAIIETGFLYLDYDIIVKQPDLPATGIANGIECFLHSNGE
jgi:N-acetylmuramoyl-L-alanine amidase